jgi:hypothetical protein
VGIEATRVRGHLGLGDPFARHAVRFTGTFLVAVLLSHWLDLPHPYWLPMTVAWISKPAQGDTTTKTVARLLGTALGVLISAVVVELAAPGDAALAILIGLATVLALTFLVGNYALAVSGVTIFVFFLFDLAGEDLGAAFWSRMLATVLAGILVIVAAVVWPTRTGARVAAALADFSAALGAYAVAVLATGADGDGGHVGPLQVSVLETRTAATSSIEAARYEVGAHRLDAVSAAAVLEALHASTAHCLVREMSGPTEEDRDTVEPIRVETSDLADRLRVVDQGAPVPARDHPPAVAHPVHRFVRRAHEALDAVPAHHSHRHHPHDPLC